MNDDTWLTLIILACVVAAFVCGFVAWRCEKIRGDELERAEKMVRDYRDGKFE